MFRKAKVMALSLVMVSGIFFINPPKADAYMNPQPAFCSAAYNAALQGNPIKTVTYLGKGQIVGYQAYNYARSSSGSYTTFRIAFCR